MLRTTLGVSFLVLVGAASACSSKSTNDDHGTVLMGGSSSGGTSAGGTGGTRSNAGNGSVLGGTGGVATGTAGGTGLCTDDTITCVDAQTASGCNPNTGETETINCVTEYAEIGLTSTGCSASLDGEGCDITEFKDQACLDGANVYANCAGGTQDDALGVYIDCFQDYMGAHAVVSCLAEYAAPTITVAQCNSAAEACFPGAGGAGAGGADGAGGAQ